MGGLLVPLDRATGGKRRARAKSRKIGLFRDDEGLTAGKNSMTAV
jgi:hypothetical protein